MGLTERFFQEWLQSEIDISLCRIDRDDNRLFRVLHKTTLFRSFVGFVFILPACWLLWWMSRQSMTEWPLLLVGFFVCIVLFGVGLLFGFSRDEVIISREKQSVIRTFRLMRLEKSFSMALPEHGQINLSREVDDGDFSCWWYKTTMTGKTGMTLITFTIAREHGTADRFAKQLADFLSWPVEDQIGTGKK